MIARPFRWALILLIAGAAVASLTRPEAVDRQRTTAGASGVRRRAHQAVRLLLGARRGPEPARRRAAPGGQHRPARESPSQGEQPDQAELSGRDHDAHAAIDRERLPAAGGDPPDRRQSPDLLDEPRPDRGPTCSRCGSASICRWSADRARRAPQASAVRSAPQHAGLGADPGCGRGRPRRAGDDHHQAQPRQPPVGDGLRRPHGRLRRRNSTASSASPPGRPSRSGSRRATCRWSRTSSTPSRWPRWKSTTRPARTSPWPRAARA